MSPTRRARRLHITASTSPRHALETLAQERECSQHRRPAKDRDKSGEIFFCAAVFAWMPASRAGMTEGLVEAET